MNGCTFYAMLASLNAFARPQYHSLLVSHSRSAVMAAGQRIDMGRNAGQRICSGRRISGEVEKVGRKRESEENGCLDVVCIVGAV